MTPDRWRGIVGVKVDSSGAHQGMVETTGTGLATGFSRAFLVAAGIMLLALVITIVAIRVRRAEPPGTTN
jgi:hypothetical protein